MPVNRRLYLFKCPSKSGCEIRTITVFVDLELLECFGFNCPFCGERMENQGEAPEFLTCYMCEETNRGPCHIVDNPEKNKDMGMPSACPYGLNVYADFTGHKDPFIPGVKE